MQGFSGTYAVNDIDFTLYPTSGKWVVRTDYGVDGGGHVVYAQNRKFEMVWELGSTLDSYQIVGFYNLVSNTGTVTVCLPEYGSPDFKFKNYSGCTLSEPDFSEYFMGYTPFKLTVMNVNTNQ